MNTDFSITIHGWFPCYKQQSLTMLDDISIWAQENMVQAYLYIPQNIQTVWLDHEKFEMWFKNLARPMKRRLRTMNGTTHGKSVPTTLSSASVKCSKKVN